MVSYLIGGVVAMLSAMCYMEFAAETSTTGASIVYTSKTFGKFVAWWVGTGRAAVPAAFSGGVPSAHGVAWRGMESRETAGHDMM